MANNGVGTQTSLDLENGFYRIGEVSRMIGVKAFVLRYWETEFPMLEPVKSSSGHRMYRQEDVDLVLKIKRLLYDEGYTIAGARRHLREHKDGAENSHGAHGGAFGGGVAASSAEDPAQLLSRKMLLDLRDTLRAFLTLLERR